MESGPRAARVPRAIRAVPKPRQGPPASRRIQGQDGPVRKRTRRTGSKHAGAYEFTSDQAAAVTCSAPRAAPCPRPPLLVCLRLLGTCVARLIMIAGSGVPFFVSSRKAGGCLILPGGHAAHGGDAFRRRADDPPWPR